MPELLTRTDDAGWMTPAIAEVLLPLPPLPYNEAYLSEQAKTIMRELEGAEAPAQVIGRVPLPSHTLFALQPGEVGRRRERRPVTVEEIRAALPRLSQALEAEAIGVLPRLRRAPDAVGLLVRGADHRPLALRTLLAQPGFQEHPSTTALALGLDLEHTVVVHDLRTLPHLLVVGAGAPKAHYLHSLLTNLMLFNTPAELQVALVGSDPSMLQPYADSPHLMGRPLRGPEEGKTALQQIIKDIARRESLFEAEAVADLHAHNVRALNAGEEALPVTLLVVDALSDPDWAAARDGWGPVLSRILARGPAVGVHMLAVSQSSDALPPPVLDPFGGWLVLRTAPGEIEKLPPLPEMPLRFVDALLVQEDGITAVEQCTAAPDEVLAVVDYWQQAAAKQHGAAPGTGPLAAPGTGPLAEPEPYISMEVGAPQRVASEAEMMQEVILPRARALGAYLGWLSTGPLRDVLGLTDQQAENVMEQLRSEGLLAPKIAPTQRFQRLEPPPE